MKEFKVVAESFSVKDPTFDDLIDVAVQAHKDGLLRSIIIENYSLLAIKNDYVKRHYKKGFDSYSEALNWFNSLYTETFVIESEEDISRVKVGAKITLSNGSEFTAELVTQLSRGWVIDSTLGHIDQTYCIFILKGATVTQQKTGK